MRPSRNFALSWSAQKLQNKIRNRSARPAAIKRMDERRVDQQFTQGAQVRSRTGNGGILAAKGVAAALCLAVVNAAACAAQAQDDSSRSKPAFIAPLPPRRPPDLGGAHIAPPTAPPSAPSLPEPPLATSPPASSVVDAPHPLPPASRERMHACGLEWQKMKASGEATDKTWREFAQICLTH